jgi:sec-independent protein translocase protein TatA
MTNPMIGMPQGFEWLVILAVVVLIFGAAKLPELARGTGQALRIFKSETKGLRDQGPGHAVFGRAQRAAPSRAHHRDADPGPPARHAQRLSTAYTSPLHDG